LLTLAIFLTVGIGLALPYVLLSWQPAWLKFVPKPGPWMQRFKILMGFPMLATAVWLFSLIPIHYGTRSLWLGIFLVIVALAAWVYGEFVQRVRARRGLSLALVLVLLAGGYQATDFPDATAGAYSEIYDPSRRRLTLTQDLSVPRALHSATVLQDGSVLVAGGNPGWWQWDGSAYLSTEIFH